MRVFVGLLAIAATASAQIVPTVSVLYGNGYAAGTNAQVYNSFTGDPSTGAGVYSIAVTQNSYLGTAGASYIDFGVDAQTIAGVNGYGSTDQTQRVNQQAYTATVPYSSTTAYYQFSFNQYTAEIKYYTGIQQNVGTPICDPCTTNQCVQSTTTGPQNNNAKCANMQARIYSVPLPIGTSQFLLYAFDWEGATKPNNFWSYSFQITRQPNIYIGDPQIVGMQGQDFQVHGMPDEIFNMVTYPNVQVNARFTYLSDAECPDNYTTCFAHPGTYISEQGFRVGRDRVHVRAGAAKKGLSVKINGKKLTSAKGKLHMGSVEIVNHRRVVVKTPIASFTMTNSDKFMNQEVDIFDDKLLSLGAPRIALKDGESFHPEVPLHGLQGQTWRNVEYPSGLEYEGSIMDYHVVSGDIYGTDFVFNKFDL